ncbi:uncharacterized protein METZ01_LOCUS415533 [marine metagenome]|uniref:Uncharacterized protein n=1 Tax=marine metagenome TaxID=408172 RepID=A0A382WVP0_9ZZZZ
MKEALISAQFDQHLFKFHSNKLSN